MTDHDALRRAAILGVALAVVVGILATPTYLAAFGWDLEAAIFVHPEAVLGRGPETAVLWRWGFLGDMLFSYLLLLPLALFSHRWVRQRLPWLADLGLAAALAYIFIGGAAAAILAQAGSSLIEAHNVASPAERPAILSSFHLLRDAFVFGVWQTLDALTAGTWAVSVGWLLLVDRPLMGRLLVVLGAWGWALGVVTMSGIHSLAVLGAGLAVAVAVWIVWVVVERGRLAPGGVDQPPAG
jgi:hypothetical protein